MSYCWWLLLLEMLKKHLCAIRSLYCGKQFTIQQYGACCHTANSVTNYLNENVHDYIRKENWSPNSCDLNLLDYAVWDIMKKILCRIPDRLSKYFINNSIQWWMWLEEVVEEEGGHIVHLIWQHWLMIPRTFLLTCC